MLSVLHIENIAVIEQADITFDAGFNVLTGETGAGKSIVIDAISAILGERAYRDVIRTGCDKAFVSAVFTGIGPLDWFAENQVEYQPEELLIQREIWLDGSPVALRGPADAVALGMGLVPEERRKQGLFLGESVSFHLGIASLKKWSRLSFLSRKKLEENARRQIERLGIKTPSPGQAMERLSGGNQQKAVVGKWLAAGCRLCLFDEPTKGVDVGAKAELLRLMTELAQTGCGVLYASADPGELLQVTDRIYVLYGGRIAAELVTAQTSEEEIMYYAVGGKAPFCPPAQREREELP